MIFLHVVGYRRDELLSAAAPQCHDVRHLDLGSKANHRPAFLENGAGRVLNIDRREGVQGVGDNAQGHGLARHIHDRRTAETMVRVQPPSADVGENPIKINHERTIFTRQFGREQIELPQAPPRIIGSFRLERRRHMTKYCANHDRIAGLSERGIGAAQALLDLRPGCIQLLQRDA